MKNLPDDFIEWFLFKELEVLMRQLIVLRAAHELEQITMERLKKAFEVS